MNKRVRVRFAPSPTGPLHIGGVRTALYNYLFAKKYNGDFILRIEDTDQNRYVPGAEDYIIDSLRWCGLQYNEGVGIGGPHAPYRQSERKHLYKQYADALVEKGFAYYAFDTPDELENTRKQLEAQKITFQYNPATRGSMKNSITLNEAEVKRLLLSDTPYVIRIKIPENEEIIVNDIIRGEVRVHSSLMDDKVLYKGDGMPTYHLANVVDDYLMKISHVIRGEEWLPSAPLHVLLYRYLGWESSMPQFAHLPLLLKPDGNGKLSKRDGDRLGFPVFPLRWTNPKSSEISSGYRESGYFPEAFINMLSLLGWHPETEQEIFTIEELTQAFSLERASKSGAKFDPEKAKWFNHQYLINKSNTELAACLKSILTEKNILANDDKVEKICELIKERANLIPDLWNQSDYFFIAPDIYDEKTIKKYWKENTPILLNELKSLLLSLNDFEKETIETATHRYIEENGLSMGQVMNSWRLTLVGTAKGPGMADIASVLGRDEVLARMNKALKVLG